VNHNGGAEEARKESIMHVISRKKLAEPDVAGQESRIRGRTAAAA